MNKVLVVQTWGIGDMIMATPMLQEVRRRWPHARATLIAYDPIATECVGGGLLDDIRVMSPIQPSPSQLLKAFLRFLRLRTERFDAAILCTTLSSRFAFLLRYVSGIPLVAGDSRPPKRMGYTHWCPLDPERHRVLSNMDILRQLIPDAKPGPLYFHCAAASRNRADTIWKQTACQGRMVLGIHPGSNPRTGKDKRVPPETIRSVIQSFLETFPDARVMLLIGPHEEGLLPALHTDDPRVVAVRGESIQVVGSLIARMRTLVAGDTGLGHIAAAVGTPTVTLAGPTIISATHPWSSCSSILTTPDSLACMPCYSTPLYDHCPYDARCMKGIPISRIMGCVAQAFASHADNRLAEQRG